MSTIQKIIAPSILAADFGNLQKEVEMINKSQAEWLHIDVMDGNFVPNISFGFPVIAAMQKHCTKKLDIHLMIAEPEKYIESFAAFKPEVISFHLEASNHVHRTLHQIKDLGIKAGIAINPHTNVNLLSDLILDVDLVCIMSVNPGFGGQKFIEKTYHKVHQLNKMRQAEEAEFLIEVDGGVGDKNIEKLSHFGCNVFVAGSSVFKNDNPTEQINSLLGKINAKDKIV